MFSNDLFLCFCVVIMSGMDGMDSMDSDEELFLTQNSFSQEILQPNFSIDSLLDAIEGSGEPAPQNSCAEELKKLVPDESIKGGPKAVQRNICKKDSCCSLFVIFCRYCFVVRYICRSHYYRKFGPNLSRGRRDFISYDVNN